MDNYHKLCKEYLEKIKPLLNGRSDLEYDTLVKLCGTGDAVTMADVKYRCEALFKKLQGSNAPDIEIVYVETGDDCSNLRQQNLSLIYKLKRLENSLNNTTFQQVADLTASNNQTEKQKVLNAKLTNNAQLLRDQITQLQNQIAQLQNNIKTNEENINKITEEKELAILERNNIETRITQLKSELLKKSEEVMTKLKMRLKEKSEEVIQLEQNMKELNEMGNNNMGILSGLRARVEKLEETNDKLSAQIDEAQKLQLDTEKKLKDVSSDNDFKRNKIAEMNYYITERQEHISNLMK